MWVCWRGDRKTKRIPKDPSEKPLNFSRRHHSLFQSCGRPPAVYRLEVSVSGVLQAALHWGWDKGRGHRLARRRVAGRGLGDGEHGGKQADVQRPLVLAEPLNQLFTVRGEKTRIQTHTFHLFYHLHNFHNIFKIIIQSIDNQLSFFRFWHF